MENNLLSFSPSTSVHDEMAAVFMGESLAILLQSVLMTTLYINNIFKSYF